MAQVLLEACVDSVESALAAQTGGAGRVELCADLLEGGITPSDGTVALACREPRIPVNVLIRPRGGDFCYSDVEFAVMAHDIQRARELGAAGVVIGLLDSDGTVDVPRTRDLIGLARPLSVTFHRAFDMARDPFEALETLVELGVDRILTSGQEASALEGLDLLADLVLRAGDRVIIMPGGGISERNIGKILAGCHPREVHASLRATREGRMTYRNTRCYMGGVLRPPEFTVSRTNADRVRQLVEGLVE
jgi:copper homeostasis protein